MPDDITLFKQTVEYLHDIVVNPAEHYPTLMMFISEVDMATLQQAADILDNALVRREDNNTNNQFNTDWSYYQRIEEQQREAHNG